MTTDQDSTQPRLLILDHEHASGRHGLALDIGVAEVLGAHPLPVPTAIASGPADAPTRLVPVAWRAVSRMLQDALDEEPAAVLVGTTCRRRQVRKVAAMLRDEAPPAVVLAPVPFLYDQQPLLGRGTLAGVLQLLVPESAAVVLPAARTPELLPGTDTTVASLKDAGRRIFDAGTRAVWLQGVQHLGRSVDIVVDRDGAGVVDYPTPPSGAEPQAAAAALAAMLAIGTTLREAIERAHRHILGLDRAVHRSTG